MSPYRVGVVIPSWNSAKTLRTALMSLKDQDGCVTDIIVADSGSTDGTLEICTSLGVPSVYVRLETCTPQLIKVSRVFGGRLGRVFELRRFRLPG